MTPLRIHLLFFAVYRDLALWQSEQAQLATVLTPRQRAQFMAMRLEFAELVQRMRQQRAAARNQGDPGTP